MCVNPITDPEEWLYRTGWAQKNYMAPNGTATSRVFKLREKDEGELSVDLASLTTPEISIGDATRFWLFQIKNETVINENLQTCHTPLEDGSNDAHAGILGLTMEDDILPGILAKKCTRILPPFVPEPEE